MHAVARAVDVAAPEALVRLHEIESAGSGRGVEQAFGLEGCEWAEHHARGIEREARDGAAGEPGGVCDGLASRGGFQPGIAEHGLPRHDGEGAAAGFGKAGACGGKA